jgi:hypothetical protein
MSELCVRKTKRKGFRAARYADGYQHWVEWQVRHGRRVLSRHETQEEAQAELERRQGETS